MWTYFLRRKLTIELCRIIEMSGLASVEGRGHLRLRRFRTKPLRVRWLRGKHQGMLLRSPPQPHASLTCDGGTLVSGFSVRACKICAKKCTDELTRRACGMSPFAIGAMRCAVPQVVSAKSYRDSSRVEAFFMSSGLARGRRKHRGHSLSPEASRGHHGHAGVSHSSGRRK